MEELTFQLNLESRMGLRDWGKKREKERRSGRGNSVSKGSKTGKRGSQTVFNFKFSSSCTSRYFIQEWPPEVAPQKDSE